MKLPTKLLTTFLVFLVLFLLVSRQTAIIRADRIMEPAIANGWTRIETRMTPSPQQGLFPVWWIRYQLPGEPHAFDSHPLAVYVTLTGKTDDWEVTHLLKHYREAGSNDTGTP